MRLALLAAALLFQGCTGLGAGLAADMNRERRAAATTLGADLAARPPAPGDTLTVRLHSGEALVGTVVTLTADTLRLDAGAVALRDINRAERPWRRQNAGRTTGLGLLADVALVLLFLRSIVH